MTFSLINSILVILVSIAVYDTLGLYDGVDTIAGKIGLGVVILCGYLATHISSD
jgi:hypothetical protein